jgi:hypothetical protein
LSMLSPSSPGGRGARGSGMFDREGSQGPADYVTTSWAWKGRCVANLNLKHWRDSLRYPTPSPLAPTFWRRDDVDATERGGVLSHFRRFRAPFFPSRLHISPVTSFYSLHLSGISALRCIGKQNPAHLCQFYTDQV